MIDRQARSQLAVCLRHLASGRISNDVFDERAPYSSEDRAVNAIWWQAWHLYSDLREHKLTGRDRLSQDTRRAVTRWIVFLHSDLEYQWPDLPLDGLLGAMLNLASLGHTGRRAYASWSQSGDIDVWPFLTRSQHEVARRQPRLLAKATPN